MRYTCILTCSLLFTHSLKPMEHSKKLLYKALPSKKNPLPAQALPTIQKQLTFSTYCDAQFIPQEIKQIINVLHFKKENEIFSENNPYFIKNWHDLNLPIKYIYLLNLEQLETINYFISSSPCALKSKKQFTIFKKLPLALQSALTTFPLSMKNNLPNPSYNKIFVYNKTMAAIDMLEGYQTSPTFGLKEYVVFSKQLTEKKKNIFG